jgi:curved DNA-binding protein CbpA
MATPAVPCPYTTLGISKIASLQEIRSAHRKLVLKCHPDKVQDPALKAVKQDEFQKVQQAYELLSDDKRRSQYDDAIKLAELRKEMGKNGPLPGGKTVFDYEVREVVPRPSTFKTKKEPTKVYAQPTPPRSYEDEIGSRGFEEPLRAKARKTASYEQPKRPSTRDEEKRRRADDERDRERWERELRKSAQGSARKSRDKERRKGGEEKYTRSAAAFVDDEDSEDAYRPKLDRRSARKMEERIEATTRLQEEQARSDEKTRKDKDAAKVLAEKVDFNKSYAAEYMLASRRKAGPAAPPPPQIIEDEFRAKPAMRRAETFDYAPSRYPPTSPYIDEEDEYVRRSSARPSSRRASEQIPSARSSREIPRSAVRERKNSTGYDSNSPFIVEAAPSPARKPTLQSHSSAPPIITSVPQRREPSRSRTTPMVYSAPPPPMSRAQTYTADIPTKSSKSTPRGSKLKHPVSYVSSESDSDDNHYAASPRSISPVAPPGKRGEVRYVIDKATNRSVPVTSSTSRHRTALRDDDYTDARDRERSESPRGTPGRRSVERPPLTRSSGSNRPSSRPPPQAYYSQSHSPEPIIIPVRPKGPAREHSGSGPRFHNPPTGYSPFEVKYAPAYGPEHVSYSAEGYRRGSEPQHYTGYPKAAYT